MSKRKQPAKKVAAPLRKSGRGGKRRTISGTSDADNATTALAGDIGQLIEDAIAKLRAKRTVTRSSDRLLAA